jgi:hypothetical protein
VKVGNDSKDRQNGLAVIQCGGWRWEPDRVSKRRCGSRPRELPKSPGHPFCTRLNALLDDDNFDRFVEDYVELNIDVSKERYASPNYALVYCP